jgi:hypothetical protein
MNDINTFVNIFYPDEKSQDPIQLKYFLSRLIPKPKFHQGPLEEVVHIKICHLFTLLRSKLCSQNVFMTIYF